MDDLIEAYNSTSYNVFKPKLSIILGKNNPKVDMLLEKYKCTEWAYITAHNPNSKVFSDQENIDRHKHLKKDLSNYSTFAGEGVGMDSTWTPERSFLILGISEMEAIKLGRKFEQKAIVVGGFKKKARLVLLKEVNNRGH